MERKYAFGVFMAFVVLIVIGLVVVAKKTPVAGGVDRVRKDVSEVISPEDPIKTYERVIVDEQTGYRYVVVQSIYNGNLCQTMGPLPNLRVMKQIQNANAGVAETRPEVNAAEEQPEINIRKR